MFRAHMLRISKSSRSHLRAVQVYLVAILALTLLLFSLSLVSIVRQQEQFKELSADKLRSDAERVALELEQKVAGLAADCLDPDALGKILPGARDEITRETAARLRQQFQDLGRRFPVARHFFVMHAGKVVYPRLGAWPAIPVSAMFTFPIRTQAERDFLALFTQGEREFANRQHARALQAFRKAEALPVSARARGLALERISRVLWESDRQAEAVAAYQQLAARHGDQYDENQTPHILGLAVRSDSRARLIFPQYSERLSAIYGDLIRGRWELSAEQVDLFTRELESRLALKPAARPKSDYLEQFDLVRAIAAGYTLGRPRWPQEVNPQLLRSADSVFHTLSILLTAGTGREIICGFSLDMDWLQNDFSAHSLSLDSGVRELELSLAARALSDETSEGPEAGPDRLVVPFKSVLAPWNLRLPLSALRAGELAARRELVFLGLSAGMFLSIMALGVILLIRVTRDLQWLQLRSDFVNAVSHELKTPLSLIRLYSETLAEGDQEFSEEERLNYIRIIARESQRLGYLIDNILDYANIERGQKKQDLKAGDLAAAVRQTLGDYSRFLAEQGFTLETEIQPFLPRVHFDRSDIAQVLVNLLDNAKKHSGKSRLLKIRMWSENSEVALEVRDSGLGIPAEEQKKIFEPFYQIPNGRTKSGSGLGLYLVRHVMDGLGGRIELSSEVGRGSTFVLFFPVAEPAPVQEPRPAKAAALESTLRD